MSIALKLTLRLQQTLSKIGKAFFKSAPIIRKRAAKEMHKRKKQPHSFDASLLPKLAFIKGEFLLAVSEKHLNAPALCIHFEDFLRGKIRLRRDKHSQCIGISQGLFRIAQQNNRFCAVAHFALIPIRIEAPMANGHEADIRIIFADGRGKCFCLLSDLVGVDDAVGAQCAGQSQSWNATCHTAPSRSSKRVHCRTASRQLPDARNRGTFSSATCGNTPLQWGAAPMTKALYARQSYRPRCRKRAVRFCGIRGKPYQQPAF